MTPIDPKALADLRSEALQAIALCGAPPAVRAYLEAIPTPLPGERDSPDRVQAVNITATPATPQPESMVEDNCLHCGSSAHWVEDSKRPDLGKIQCCLCGMRTDGGESREVARRRWTRRRDPLQPVTPEDGEAVRKKSMTLNLSDEEMAALEGMAEKQDLSPGGVLRQGLRHYQLLVHGPVDLGPMLPPDFDPAPAAREVMEAMVEAADHAYYAEPEGHSFSRKSQMRAALIAALALPDTKGAGE